MIKLIIYDRLHVGTILESDQLHVGTILESDQLHVGTILESGGDIYKAHSYS